MNRFAFDNFTLPRRYDGLTDVDEEEEAEESKTKVQVSMFKNGKEGFLIDIKKR